MVGSSRVWVKWIARLIAGIALDAVGDAVHHLHRFARILAGRAFRRQHHRVGAVVDRGRDVADLGARRRRRGDHRFEHLGRDHHRLAELARAGDDLVLQRRHLLGRKLDAEVAARDHHRVGQRDDVVQAIDRRRLLDLGEQRRALADQRRALRRRPRAAGRTTERSSRRAARARTARSSRSLSVSAGIGTTHVGDVDALVVGDRAADLDFGDDPVVVGLEHVEPHLAVVDQDAGAGPDRLEQLGWGSWTRLAVARPCRRGRR